MVVGDACRLVGLIVATLVNGDDVIVLAELLQLVSPAVPKLGKAVHEENQLLLGVARFDVVDFNSLRRK